MATPASGVVVVDHGGSSFRECHRLREWNPLRIHFSFRPETVVGHEAVIGVGKDEITSGKLMLDPVEPPVPPALGIVGLDFGSPEAIGGKDNIPKNAGLLDGRD